MSAELSLFPAEEVEEPAARAAGERASLYRNYRSLSFAEVVGQQHVTQTLRNAVRYGTVGHAYLFTGPRGTGKTSTARILARAVNCLQSQDGEPCNRCAMCRGMLERRSLDLVEIDAASNNSVDDVRELRERVNFRPAEARRKVFIIDEVHMLSISAFNALLKTLEEPPEHVLFALATTEVHKVPATVLSRCQQFNLRPVAAPEMLERLRYVCGCEGITAGDDVLSFVVVQSTGSLRDALSLLEQIRAYCGDELRLPEVEAALGIARVGQVATLAEAMAGGKLEEALLLVGSLMDGGIDPRQLARQISGYWRDALVGRSRGQPVAEPTVAQLRADSLVSVLRSLLQVESSTRRSDSPRWALELAIADATLGLAQGSGAAAPATPARQAQPAVAEQPVRQQMQPRTEALREPVRAATPAALAVTEEAPPPTPARESQTAPTPAVDRPREQNVKAEDLTHDAGRNGAVVGPTRAQVQEQWLRVLAVLRPTIRGYLAGTTSDAVSVEGTQITIGFPAKNKFHREQLDMPANRQVAEQAFSQVLGIRCTVRCVTIEGMAPPVNDDYLEELAAEHESRQRARRG